MEYYSKGGEVKAEEWGDGKCDGRGDWDKEVNEEGMMERRKEGVKQTKKRSRDWEIIIT